MRSFYIHPQGMIVFKILPTEVVVGMLSYDAITKDVHICNGITESPISKAICITWHLTEEPEHLALIKTTLLLIE